jgi:uncharacterized membrane protein (DUF106 family)
MQDLFAALMAWFEIFRTPPFSGVLITLVSLGVTLTSNLAMKRFTDVRRLKRYQVEIKQYQDMLKQAKKTQDEKLARKIRRRKAYIDRIQKEMLGARCKPLLMFFVPFMMIFYLLSGFFSVGGTQQIVAVIPFNIHKIAPWLIGLMGYPTAGGFGLYYVWFYMLVGFGLGQILQRAMGISLT